MEPADRPPRLGRLASPALSAADRPILVVPLGATEQHGPHLPLDTDTVIAVAWAERVAARLPDAIVAPALPYGSSGEHQRFPGTLSIGAEALEHVLVELGRSAREHFGSMVVLSGHAGNVRPVAAAIDRLRYEGQRIHHFFPSWPGSTIAPIDAHAGRTETSLMLHLAPGSVDAASARPGNTAPAAELLPAMEAGGVDAVSPTGVLGDPTGASAEEGARLLDDLVERTVAALADAGGEPE